MKKCVRHVDVRRAMFVAAQSKMASVPVAVCPPKNAPAKQKKTKLLALNTL